MRLIYQGGFSRDEREFFKKIIYSSTVQSMRSILEAMESFGLCFDEEHTKPHAQTILTHQAKVGKDDFLPSNVSAAIAALWKDRGLQECFKQSREHLLDDSTR